MAEPELITATRLRELLHYDPETGILTRRKTGRIVSTPNNRGYLVIRAAIECTRRLASHGYG